MPKSLKTKYLNKRPLKQQQTRDFKNVVKNSETHKNIKIWILFRKKKTEKRKAGEAKKILRRSNYSCLNVLGVNTHKLFLDAQINRLHRLNPIQDQVRGQGGVKLLNQQLNSDPR